MGGWVDDEVEVEVEVEGKEDVVDGGRGLRVLAMSASSCIS